MEERVTMEEQAFDYVIDMIGSLAGVEATPYGDHYLDGVIIDVAGYGAVLVTPYEEEE